MSVFKKVIGQDTQDNRPQPTPAPRPQQAAPAPAQQSAPPAQPAPASAQPVQQAAIRNVLSTDVEIQGTVKFNDALVVDGKIEGEIFSDGALTIGENANIKAEVKTGTIVVYGKVHGNLTASERIDLKASAEVVGDIKTKTLSMEAGAVFVGKSTVGASADQIAGNAPAKPQPQPSKPGQPQPQQQGGNKQSDLKGIKS